MLKILSFALTVAVCVYAQTSPELVMGTATNPIIKGDVPDPSIIRVDDAYYMVSTTMYFSPVAPIMKSYDLINWKIISYCTDILEDLPAFRLETETTARIGDYGRGQWASSLRYYNNRFWVIFTCLTTGKSYVFSTTDPENVPWTRTVINRQFHDPSLFLDEKTNKMYVVHGNGNITLTEMESNLSGVKTGGVNKTIISSPDVNGGTGAEGAHVYYLNGYYYVFLISIWPRVELCYRSTNIEGPYEGRLVLNKGLGNRTGGVAQGGIIQTPDGDWYGFLFQDRDGIGRVPVLVPMHWGNDNWPVFGDANGNVPVSFQIKQAKDYGQNLYVSDEFDSATLPLAWQWNHNPDSTRWSLTAKPGYLRLTTVKVAKTIFHARNTLTQRTFEPASEGIVAMEPANMKDGDIAGLVALGPYAGFVGIEQEGSQKYVVMYTADNDDATAGSKATTTRRARAAFTGSKIYFKLNFRFKPDGVNTETAVFAYSTDGTSWQSIGTTLNIRWTMSHFTGYRFGLFNYATKEAGGYVDFDYFHVNSSSQSGQSSSSSSRPSSSSSSSVARSSSSIAPSSSSSAVRSSSSAASSSSSATESSSSVVPSSSSADETSSSSEEIVSIAHYPLTAHSKAPTYYTIKGEPVGSIKPAKPGVYLVKQGSSVKKIVVR